MSSILQASSSDTSEITDFIEHCSLIQRHLDWEPLLGWLDTPPFLKFVNDAHIEGVFASPPDPPGVAWIKCFACGNKQKAQGIFQSMLMQALHVLEKKVHRIMALGLQPWFVTLLEKNNFTLIQNVVVLKHMHFSQTDTQECDAFIRPMELLDIEQVAYVDAAAFEPIWSLSRKGLQAAFFQSAHTSVAELDGQIIGYELSTGNAHSAHLARVAVLPGYQKKFIGCALVSDMLTYFIHQGIREITVNTQDTNAASIHLYQKLGFILTGAQFPVYQHLLPRYTGQ